MSYRSMAYNYDVYYASPMPTNQQLGTRSASVSSNSSSASYSLPYSNGNAHHHGSISRTMSPASGISDPGAGLAMYSRGHYSGPSHQHSPASHPVQPTSLTRGQSQFLQAQAALAYPLCSPAPTPRPVSRASPYGGYPAATLPQHTSPLSYHAYAPLYPSFAVTTAYQPSPDLVPYHTPPLSHSPPVTHHPEVPEKSHLQLPEKVINKIRTYLTWDDCRRAYQVSRWFRDNFHPNMLPEDEKTAGLLNEEKNRKLENWSACYHCFTFKGLEHFELSPLRGMTKKDCDDAEQSRTSLSPPHTPAPPTSNPHYDPSLTGTSLKLAAARKARLRDSSTSSAVTGSGSGGDGSYMDQRMKETWRVRRFCIDCGLRNRWYRPGDVIELRKPLERGQGYWVCRCWKFHLRPDAVRCEDCSAHIPLSTRARRR
ncbi:uncharacterized protein B0T15DRAFT_47216 [Chaetomium strumarium]|uniref:F-box domain-containing protein n=1 Tax=Chaetomium strumarium TaxID=1170767 RepID=A0AAJ0H2R5_9PEZI|nr:hypothetical protein B0T15DRAFT_47216 [Chaetomium strumarium]